MAQPASARVPATVDGDGPSTSSCAGSCSTPTSARIGTRPGKWWRSAWRTVPTAGSSERVWPKAAKSSTQPPPPGAPAEQPGAPHGDAVLLRVAPGDDVPVVGDGCAGQDLLPGDRPADGGAHAHGQVRIERGRPASRDRQRVERGQLAEDGAEPARPGIQQLGRPADAVGQRPGLRVDQAGRRALPRRARRRVRRGQAPPDLVGQPAVQLVQAGSDPRRPLVGPLLLAPVRRRRTRRSTERRRPVPGRARRCVRTGLRRARPRRGPPATWPPARAGPWWARCPRPTAAAARGCACTAPSGSGTSSARPGRRGPPSPRRARPRCRGRGPRRRRRRSRGSTTSSAWPDRAPRAPPPASGARASTSAVDQRAGVAATAGGR